MNFLLVTIIKILVNCSKRLKSEFMVLGSWIAMANFR